MTTMILRKGFTLVELSIVLVIIGLLIGGILIGQSLIESARMYGLIKEISQYNIAFSQFKYKYKYYPGDAPATVIPGNYYSGGPYGDGMLNQWRDNITIWYQLASSNILSFKDMGIATPYTINYGVYESKINLPEFKFRKKVGFAFSSISNFALQISEEDPATAPNAPLTSIESMQLDQKVDDGFRTTGNYTGGTCGGCNWTQSASFPYYHCHGSAGPSGYSTREDARCNMNINFQKTMAH